MSVDIYVRLYKTFDNSINWKVLVSGTEKKSFRLKEDQSKVSDQLAEEPREIVKLLLEEGGGEHTPINSKRRVN